MTRPRETRVAAVALLAMSVACVVVAAVIPFVWGAGAGGLLDSLLGAGSFGLPLVLVGFLITWRRPDHPIGWGFALAGLCSAVQTLCIAYADAAYRPGGPHLSGAAYAGNLTQWIFAPGVYLGYTLPFLLFPDGHLLSRRWRWVAWVGAISTVVMSVANIIAPGPLNNYPHVTNPLAVDGPYYVQMQTPGILVYLGALFAAAAGVFIRFRRARGIERLQMRWFMVGVAGTAVGFTLQILMLAFTGDVGPAVLFMAVLPICAGIAILRYRLFDIDRVISRTVAYAAVTALVVAPYLVLSVAASRLASGSAIAVAALTLATLAVLRPVHRRLQRGVDRRFNRERYDAARTVDAFAQRLRDEVDADVVHRDLLDVADRAVQPASISLWVAH